MVAVLFDKTVKRAPRDRVTRAEAARSVGRRHYDFRGNATSVVQTYGATGAGTVSKTFDPMGRLKTSTDPAGGVVTYTYDVDSNRVGVEDQDGHATRFDYDDLDRLEGITQPNPGTGDSGSPVTIFEYDKAGNRTSVKLPGEKPTVYKYDKLSRPASATNPDGSTVTYVYNADGTVYSSKTALSKATTYVYDNLKRPTQVTDPDGNATATEYDWRGNVTKVTDANHNVTRYEYDLQGNKIWEYTTSATGELSRHWVYDKAGNLASYTDRENRTTTYTYDNLNRRISEKWDDTSEYEATYTFNEFGDLQQAQDTANGHVNSTHAATTFDSLGRATAFTDSLNDSTGTSVYSVAFTTEYDPTGARKELTASDSGGINLVNSYIRDDLGRVISESQYSPTAAWTPKTVAYAYRADGGISRIDRYEAMTRKGTDVLATDYSYNAAGQLTGMVYDGGVVTPTVHLAYGWKYDAKGRLVRTESSDGVQTIRYDQTDQQLDGGSGDTILIS
jgi:large repetitive protein